MSDSCYPIDSSPPGSSVPGILHTRTLGCHFLLQCMKVKSEREVVQSCPILSDPMDCSPPGTSIHGIFQARVLEWGAIAFLEYSYIHIYKDFPDGLVVKKNIPAMQKTRVRSLGQEDPLKEGMATHSSTLAWKIPWMEVHGRLQSMGLQRVRHD